MLKLLPALFAVLIALIGCAANPTADQDEPEQQASTLYNQAHALIEAGDYTTAVKRLEDLQAKYPFGPYSEQAQLDIIYAYYKANDTASAVAAADRFIRFNPRHAKVAYAYYMKGVAQQKQGRSFVQSLLNLDRSKRDPEPLRQAFYSFRTLLESYPESRYTDDARRRMAQLRNLLAEHEVHIMKYYVRRNAWVAAINRARDILLTYSKTPAVADALHVLLKGYEHIGLSALTEDVRRVIRLNYPNHPALEERG
ncbi:MAG: outer membrane protein assembly factor BamD [Nitrococcus sp.]|nr:outer membrane protein assembly factor BamD [Nitrococcus sp.]